MYKLYDDYDMTMELIGKYPNKAALNAGIDERVADTDGECYLIVKECDPNTGIWSVV